jgi:phosphatidate cytidylyltransferase
MLAKRLISVAIIVPLLLLAIYLGGWWFAAFLTVFVAIASWELARLFKNGGHRPWWILMCVGSAGIIIAQRISGFEGAALVLGVDVLLAMFFHTIAFEKGIKTSAADFMITVGGILYLGWMASYLVALRQLSPTDGGFWTLLVIAAIAIADAAAYFIGSAMGKHKMLPVVSPKKSWEGYLGGVVVGTGITILLAFWFHTYIPAITWQKGLVIGFVISVLAPMGDFGESMLKRQFNMKDSSELIPGHGGFLDRIDSYIWAALLGYYLVLLLIH